MKNGWYLYMLNSGYLKKIEKGWKKMKNVKLIMKNKLILL